jgi:hypothetical protein
MKQHHKTLGFGLLLVSIPVALFALNGTTLDVTDTTTAANSVDSESAAIGHDNTAHHESTAIGHGNTAGYYSASIGAANNTHYAGFASGGSNTVHKYSGAIGRTNIVNWGGLNSYPRNSLAVGQTNIILGSNLLAVGKHNCIGDPLEGTGTGFVMPSDNSIVLGTHLTNTMAKSATIVGTYNEDKAAVLFVVGDGEDLDGPTGSGLPDYSNALEVYDDGRIVIKKQGDVPMGNYN